MQVSSFDVITFILAFLSLLIALYSIWLSNKSDEYSQFQIIMNMYSNLASIEKDLVSFQSGGKNEDLDLYRQSKEQLLNHYEIYCLHYLRNSINKDTFEQLFKDNIIRMVEHETYNKYFQDDSTIYNFEYIKKAYSQLKSYGKNGKWWEIWKKKL